jgi:uncharacterized membrane protein
MTGQKIILAKTITWRILGITITFIVALWISGHLEGSLFLTIVVHLIKTGVYWLHEQFYSKLEQRPGNQ